MTTPSELRGLSERATPGEWDANPIGAEREDTCVFAPTLAGGQRQLIAAISVGTTAQANARFIAACVNEIRRQLSEGEGDRVCAARYRWLRDTRGPITTHVVTWTRVADDREEYAMVTGDDLDAAIDAALSAQHQGDK